MATKFKVGDKLIGNKKNTYPITKQGTLVEVVDVALNNVVGDIKVKVLEGRWKNYAYWVDSYYFDLYRSPCAEKIVITSDGVTTTATRYSKNTKVSEATSRCSPEDKFDFNVGAKLALDRLTNSKWNIVKVKFESGIVLYHYKTTESNVKAGMLIKVPVAHRGITRECTATVVEVIKGDKYTDTFPISDMTEISIVEVPKYYNGKVVCLNNRSNELEYTVGKIYEFKDGVATFDRGSSVFYRPVKDFTDLTKLSLAKWLEIVE